jgi:hypothetical protein
MRRHVSKFMTESQVAVHGRPHKQRTGHALLTHPALGQNIDERDVKTESRFC